MEVDRIALDGSGPEIDTEANAGKLKFALHMKGLNALIRAQLWRGNQILTTCSHTPH
jgi:hypothetical protein